VSRSQKLSKRTSQPDLLEQRDSSSGVAGDRSAVAKDEPPALVASFLRHGRQQAPGLLVIQRQECQVFVSVEVATTRAAQRQNFQVSE
jgi:hypothetical protein